MIQELNSSLKKILLSLPEGIPVTTSDLKKWGVPLESTYYYVRAGWLTTLGSGYYLRIGDELTLKGAIAAMQDHGVPVHVGGKTALEWQGISHYLNLGKPKLELYGITKSQVPPWLANYATSIARPASLFDEPTEIVKRLFVSPLNNAPHSPLVSEPERALLEMLASVPQEQSLDEAEKLMESLYTLRPDGVQSLLMACRKVKVSRLFFYLATKMGLPVLAELDRDIIEFGSAAPHTYRTNGHVLILKNPIRDTDSTITVDQE